jgi:prevent-host-death family protein
MKATTISEAKNRLSALLERVKAGETVLITDRGVPIARIEPIAASADPTGRSIRLARAGLLKPAATRPAEQLLAGPTVRLPDGISGVDAVVEERRSGR